MPTHERIRAGRSSPRAALARTRRLLSSGSEPVPVQRIALAAPVLIDSVLRKRVETLLDLADPALLRASAHLSLAFGRSLALRGHPDDALPWLLRAQSLGRDTVAARSTYEIGCIYLERGEVVAAEVVASTGSLKAGDDRSADLAHLAALVAEARGEPELAESRYRHAIERSAEALSPYTRVAALRNLASAMCQRDPAEAASLCGLGLAIIEAEELDRSARPSLLNVLCYALLSSGGIAEGRERGVQAAAEAADLGVTRISQYAHFNVSLSHELDGDIDRAAQLLRQLSDRLDPGDELRGWCVIRLAWLAARAGDVSSARHILERSLGPPKRAHDDSVEALRGIIACLAGSASQAIGRLEAAIAVYDDRRDLLTGFALRLWLAYALGASGRRAACERTVRTALMIGQRQGFRLSPNYWHPLLVEIASRSAPPEQRGYAAALLPPVAHISVPPIRRAAVAIESDGSISLDGTPIEPARWRIGRSGSNVLRRLFAIFVASHPVAIRRDELMDLLWPDSDGDRATANLYSATNDLRHFLGDVPGVALELTERGYRLRIDENVELRASSRTAPVTPHRS